MISLDANAGMFLDSMRLIFKQPFLTPSVLITKISSSAPAPRDNVAAGNLTIVKLKREIDGKTQT